MAYHTDYWVAVAAAAPVLFVAHVVAATQVIDVVRIPARGAVLAAALISLTALLISGTVLLTALNSLADGRNDLSPSVVNTLVFVILLGTMWQLVAWTIRRASDPAAHS